MPDRYVVGIEAAYDYVRAGLIKIGDEPKLIHTYLYPQRAQVQVVQRAARNLITRIDTAIQDLLEESPVQVSAADIDAIGISVPGAVDESHMELIEAHHLAIYNMALASAISKDFQGIKTRLVNDSMARAVAEQQYGAARGLPHVVYVLVGWGIGSALIFHGQPYLGAGGIAGEFGHVKIAPDGAICNCGSVGCVEGTASLDAVANRLWSHIQGGWATQLTLPQSRDEITIEFLRSALEAQDRLTVALIDTAATALGRALASVINLLTPSAIIMGGEFVEGIDRLSVQAIDAAKQNAIPLNAGLVKILKAELGVDAAVLGAAYLVKQTTY